MNNDITETLISFISSIGINVYFERIEKSTFLDGIAIKDGSIIVDREKLSYPGDLLHEAGHIAVTPLSKRECLNDNVDSDITDGGNEMAAIAWSYAACKYLNIDPHIVFHEQGYKGEGASIVSNFSDGRCFGVPLLQWYGMTYEAKSGNELQVDPYPNMVNWLSQH